MMLKTERLELIPIDPDDLSTLHHQWTDPDVRRYLWDDRIISTDEVAGVIAWSQESFAAHGFGIWLLRHRQTREPVGFVGLRHFDTDEEIEVLYGLAPSFWRQGLATEASHRVLHFAFCDLDLPEIFAGADPPNRRSIWVMERLGFVPHGRRVLEGVETDYYALSRRQFLARESVDSKS